jgi:hypothetical protein
MTRRIYIYTRIGFVIDPDPDQYTVQSHVNADPDLRTVFFNF